MIKLSISQNNEITKPINENIIEFLYQLCKGLDDNVEQYLCGRVEITHGYIDAINFLTQKFEDLYIISTNDPYIRFADPNTEAVCVEMFGNGDNGLTITNARSATVTVHKRFYGKSIGSFDEFKYFINIHTLPSECFKQCTNLTDIDLINITDLDDRGNFSGCTNLTILKNYQNITRCGGGVFTGCNLIGDFDFSNITVINNDRKEALCFNNNTNLTSVKLPEIQETLCSFYNCTNLKHITNGINIKTISHEYLFKCSSLEELDFPNLETISNSNACSGCTSLTSINFPKLTSIGGGAFYGCTNLSSAIIPNVVNIGNYAFNKCTSLQSINLPNLSSFTSAYPGKNVFFNCTNLQSASLPAITTIPESIFEGCSKLTTANITWENIVQINKRSFFGCSLLTYQDTINLSTCTSIGEGAFSGCSSITSINISSCTSIGNSAFYGCTSLTSIGTLSSNLTSIGRNVFFNCKNLQSISLPPITTIPDNIFEGCSKLTTINITWENIVQINQRAFFGCNLLTYQGTINLSSCTSIGSGAFYGCSSITSIDVSSCESIGNVAFYGCTSLTSIGTLNSELTSIGSWCFYNCSSLTGNLDIPESVTSLGDGCFAGCTSLTSITFNSLIPPTRSGTSQFNQASYIIYVPSSAVNTYKSQWSNVSSRIQPIP